MSDYLERCVILRKLVNKLRKQFRHSKKLPTLLLRVDDSSFRILLRLQAFAFAPYPSFLQKVFDHDEGLIETANTRILPLQYTFLHLMIHDERVTLSLRE
jgi:hypothetical protein